MILEQFQRIICFFEIDKEWWSKPIILQSSCWENCYIFWLNRQFAFAFWIAKPYCESLCENFITDSEFKVVLARLVMSWKKSLVTYSYENRAWKTKCLFSELRNDEEYFLAFIPIVSRALFKETWLSWITFLHWINFSQKGKYQCFSFNTQMFVRIKFIRGEQINSDKLPVFICVTGY